MYVIVDIGIMVYCTNFSLDHICKKKPQNILDEPLNFQLNLYQVILFDIFAHLYIGQGSRKIWIESIIQKVLSFAKLEATYNIFAGGINVQTIIIQFN